MKNYRIIGIILFVSILVLYYYGLSLRVPMNSDGATGVLQAKEMIDGNLFLRNWYLSTGAYITTDLALYAMLIPVLGFSTKVIFLGTSFFYAGMVILCMWLSGKNGSEFSYKRAFITFLIIGAPVSFSANIIFSGPMHVSSLMYCLIALLVWENAKNIYVKYGVFFVFLTLVLISDPFALWFFVLPFVLACVYQAFRDRRELISLGMVILSYVASKIILKVIGFDIPSIGATRFLQIDEFKLNLSLTVEGILELYGANFFGKSISFTTLIILIHLIILLLVVFVMYLGIKKVIRNKPSTLELFLILAIVINVAEYIGSNMAVNLATTRYILPAFVFVSIYLGKYAIERLDNKKIRTAVSITYVIFFVTSLQSVSYNKPITPFTEVVDFLQSKGLKYGYGSYWNSSIITLESNDAVKVRPIIHDQDTTPFEWLSKTDWYKEPANFLIFDSTNWGNINKENAEIKFGIPDNTYQFKDYTILHWDKDISRILID
ncbi:hypothetical protein [Paenibacillus sinopodophylli]|uniref:hypothetical protein n=1 Tax=Paenibacillus sinopodophylli TaxID=1837342 RepID=UPI00110CB249|nr:hypothetical protein [Paenibacillus sinopodophylli]